jgi:succinyl-CoA synthetase beta subunit
LVLTKKQEFQAASIKVTIEKNSYYRQAEVLTSLDQTQYPSLERIALNLDLNYTKLNGPDGTIGVISNGNALCLATIDMIEHYGGKAANYLDLGSDANAD